MIQPVCCFLICEFLPSSNLPCSVLPRLLSIPPVIWPYIKWEMALTWPLPQQASAPFGCAVCFLFFRQQNFWSYLGSTGGPVYQGAPPSFLWVGGTDQTDQSEVLPRISTCPFLNGQEVKAILFGSSTLMGQSILCPQILFELSLSQVFLTFWSFLVRAHPPQTHTHTNQNWKALENWIPHCFILLFYTGMACFRKCDKHICN